MKNPIVGLVIVAILFGALGFFGGMQYQKSQRSAAYGQIGAQGQARRLGQNGGQNAQAVRGQVLSADNSSLTVKLSDGSSKIIILSSSTSITEATATSKQSLKAGEQVAVFGSSNSDGSVTAQNIQLNPQTGQFNRGGNPPTGSSAGQ